MIPRVEPEGMLFGKPVSTFPDHALDCVADGKLQHIVLAELAAIKKS
jgi:hypothetical protein